jgi:hypothetical protein
MFKICCKSINPYCMVVYTKSQIIAINIGALCYKFLELHSRWIQACKLICMIQLKIFCTPEAAETILH